jgi:sugar phosphate isomerase/epimerase
MRYVVRYSNWMAGVVTVLATLLHAAEPAQPPVFFAMATAINGPAPKVAETLKELGYAGIGGGGYSAELVKELEARGLKFFNAYLTLQFDSAKPALTDALRGIVDGLKGHDSALWIAIQKVTLDGKPAARESAEGDAVVVAKINEIADYAEAHGVKIALYPHTGMYIDRCDDTVRLCAKIKRPSVGATFNLCHFLKVEGDSDPVPVLQRALPYLFFVSINGADSGATKTMGWERLIQTLDKGDYDTRSFLKKLRDVGYTGPIAFQGYGIKGDAHDNLARTMAAWRKLTAAP